jgi:hypothetical protein
MPKSSSSHLPISSSERRAVVSAMALLKISTSTFHSVSSTGGTYIQSDPLALADDRPREEEEEVQRQRRQENARQVLRHLQDFVAPVDVARRRVDVNDKRQQRDEVEESALLRLSSEEREQSNREIEEADEAEDEVRDVDLQLRRPIRDVEDLPGAIDDHRHRTPDAPQRLLHAFDFRGRRPIDHPHRIAGTQTSASRIAAGIDALDDDRAVVALKREVDSLERGAFALERHERTEHDPDRQDRQQRIHEDRLTHEGFPDSMPMPREIAR